MMKKSQRDFMHHRSFFESLINTISMPILVIGTDMEVKFINPAAEVIFSDRTEFAQVGAQCYRFLFGQDTPCPERGKSCPLVDCQETGGTVRTEFRLDIPRDFPRYYEIFATQLFSEDGAPLGIIELFNDITDWKLFEKWLKAAQEDSDNLARERTSKLLEINKALRQEVHERQRAELELIRAKNRSELMYRVIPSAIFTVDLNQRITSWNDKAEAITGYSREEIVGKHCSVFALNPCTEQCGVYSDSIPKPIVGRECQIRTKDGRICIVAKNGDFLHDDNGNVIGAVESFEDITEKKKIEEQLSIERDKLKGMISTMGQGMHILNRDFNIEYQNDVACKAFGDQLGQKCYRVYKELAEPCDVCLMKEAIETYTIQRTEILMSNNRHYELSYTPFKDIDEQIKVLILLRDNTEEKIMRAETMQAVQLASVGKLAAGVAHEINNPINGIINYAQIIQDEAEGSEILSDISEKIIREGERVANIVSNLLSFARQQDETHTRVALKDVIRDATDLIKHQLTKNCILIEVNLPDDLPPVLGHHQQLQQVFLNLFGNARFALNQRFSGKDPDKKIIIDGTVVTINGTDYVQINFKDLGVGIPEEVVHKIFEPFFSSKSQGEGTGLGLSISKEIITKHNGYLHVNSDAQSYTDMVVGLPVYTDEE